MNRNLLIVGAGTYAFVASEIAAETGCFERIAFVDDERKTTSTGIAVSGTLADMDRFFPEYSNIIVAIGNPEVRLSVLKKIQANASWHIVSLISPKAYVSPSAKILPGCIIEPMAVVHTDCVIGMGCILSAGAIVNHTSVCCEVVHVDCNATVEGYCCVPTGTKINSGDIYKKSAALECANKKRQTNCE